MRRPPPEEACLLLPSLYLLRRWINYLRALQAQDRARYATAPLEEDE